MIIFITYNDNQNMTFVVNAVLIKLLPDRYKDNVQPNLSRSVQLYLLQMRRGGEGERVMKNRVFYILCNSTFAVFCKY